MPPWGVLIGVSFASPKRCRGGSVPGRLPDSKEGRTAGYAPIAAWIDGDDAIAQPPACELRGYLPEDANLPSADRKVHRRGERREQQTVLVDANDCFASTAVVEDVEAQRRSLPPLCDPRVGRDERRPDVGRAERVRCR